MSKFDNVVIRASAGTGKTFQLTNRFIGLLNRDVPVDEILATTFTRKAAGEILERVLLRLAKAATDNDACAQLRTALKDSSISRMSCLMLLEKLSRVLHRLRVSTLDSFFAQIALSFSLEIGLPIGWTIADDLTDSRLRSEAIETVLRGDSRKEVMRLLHLMFQGEAERDVSSVLKTTVNELYSVFLSATPDAWGWIIKPTPLSESERDAVIDAITSVHLEHARMASARDTGVEDARAGAWDSFIGRGLGAKVANEDPKFYSQEIPADLVALYEKLIANYAAGQIAKLADRTEATYQLLQKFDVVYRRLKLEQQVLRFEDVTQYLGEWESGQSMSEFEFRLDASISHLLLDEFQDTSLIQWQVLKPFAEQITAAGEGQQSFFWDGGQKSFFCVGDVKQAIYGWRGGKSEIFNVLDSHLGTLRSEVLATSYRSSQPVIDFVNLVFRKMHNHDNLEWMEQGIAEFGESFPQHTTSRKDLAGYVKMETAAESPSPEYNSKNWLLQYTAEKIKELITQAPQKSMGVLVRKNANVATLVYHLRKLGVPASEEGGQPATDSAAVEVVLSLLQIIDHPADTIARFHLAHSPLGEALGYKDWEDKTATQDLFVRCRQEWLASAGEAIEAWAGLLIPSSDRRDRVRLSQVVQLAWQYQNPVPSRTENFIELVRGQRVSDPTSADVRVMTYHQAKGLEFDIVVLPDLDTSFTGQPPSVVTGSDHPTEPINRICLYADKATQQILPPDLRGLFEHAKLEKLRESLAVLYVALTRAVHALHIIIEPTNKTLSKSAAGLIRAAVVGKQEHDPGEVVYEYGDPLWFEKHPAIAEKEVKVRELKQVILADASASPTRRLERTPPSSLEGGTSVLASDLLRLGSSPALARGTLIHAFCEAIEWLDEGIPSEQKLLKLAAKYPMPGIDKRSCVQDFQKMLSAEGISRELVRGKYQPPRRAELAKCLPTSLENFSLRLEVHNERTFAIRHDNRLVTGAIDRLVLMFDRQELVAAEIIDFKTDRTDPADEAKLNELVEHYRPQQEAYRDAVSKAFRLPAERIGMKLLFLAAGKSLQVE